MAGEDRKDCTVELEGVEAKAEAGPIGVRTRHRNPNKAKFRKELIEGDDWNHDRGKVRDRDLANGPGKAQTYN